MRVVSFRSDIKFSFYIFEKKIRKKNIFLSLKGGNWGVSLFATELNPRVNEVNITESDISWTSFLIDEPHFTTHRKL